MESSSYEEVLHLRRECLGLQRRLRSGQRKLRDRVHLLTTSSGNRARPPRIRKSDRIRTSTPNLNLQDHTGNVPGMRDTANRRTSLRKHKDYQVKGKASRRVPRLISTETDPETPSSPSGTSQSEDDKVSRVSLNGASEGRSCSRRGRPTRRKATDGTLRVKQNTLIHDERESRGDGCFRPQENGDIPPKEESPLKLTLDATPGLKSILATPGVRQQRKTPNRVAFLRRLNRSSSKRTPIPKMDRSLLGYDFIAGVLESDSRKAASSEEFFEEICQFRQLHREQCVHDPLDSLPDVSVQNPSEERSNEIVHHHHKCIHNYAVNQRLFPVALNEAEDGNSLCAICQSRRDPSRSTRTSPSYIRVSIPRSTLASPYRVRSHRRKSFDPTDSLGISKHCLSGWQCSKPSMMPTAGSLDIKSSLRSTVPRTNFHPQAENLPPTEAQIPKTSRRTQTLLNRSLGLRLDGWSNKEFL